MQRLHQLIFIASVLGLCWLAMMAIHELGHILGAWTTGGHVRRVILHPLTISQTDVAPNPNPGIVVWMGPILGCVIPVLIWLCTPGIPRPARSLVTFFTGFCLVANGGYIAIGAFDRVGDCAVMLDHGSPFWSLLVFGAVAMPIGFFVWHQLGSVKEFLTDPTNVDPKTAYVLLALLVTVAGFEALVFPK